MIITKESWQGYYVGRDRDKIRPLQCALIRVHQDGDEIEAFHQSAEKLMEIGELLTATLKEGEYLVIIDSLQAWAVVWRREKFIPTSSPSTDHYEVMVQLNKTARR